VEKYGRTKQTTDDDDDDVILRKEALYMPGN